MCTWANTQNLELDKLDWELTNQETEKHYSTPHSDHTLGTERGDTCASQFSACRLDSTCSPCVYLVPSVFSMFSIFPLGSFHVLNVSNH